MQDYETAAKGAYPTSKPWLSRDGLTSFLIRVIQAVNFEVTHVVDKPKAMGIHYQSRITGAPACLWPPPFGPTETFRVLPAEDGWVYLENFTSGKVLGVLGGSTEDGAKIVQGGKNESDDQKGKVEVLK